MGPGATALTLMPLLTNWLDSERVNAICTKHNSSTIILGHTYNSTLHRHPSTIMTWLMAKISKGCDHSQAEAA
jgi:hypothetical protein